MSVGYPDGFDDAQRIGHKRMVARCLGAICTQAIALHFRASPIRTNELEVQCGFAQDVADASGVIRGWSNYGKRPSEDSINRVKAATDGVVDLGFWVKHPLIELMQLQPPSLSRLKEILEQRSTAVRRILLLEPDSRGEFSHHTPERHTVLRLRNRGGLDGFVAMLCLARRGELQGEIPAHSLPAMCAYDMFPRVLLNEPLLQYEWARLAECLHRVFWNRVYEDGATLPLGLERLQCNVDALVRNPRARYRWSAGRLVNRAQQIRSKILLYQLELEHLEHDRRS